MKDISLSPRLAFILTVVSSFIILLPSLVLQEALAQGDHGRDLFAFVNTANGGVPYQDYVWLYGPLMPFYFAFFFKAFGVSILSVLFAETLFKLACVVTFFSIMRQAATPLWSFLATIFFITFFPFFFHTYTYTGGIFLILLTIAFLFQYMNTRRTLFLYAGLLPIFLLIFIKINMGVNMWISYMLCVFLIDRAQTALSQRKLFYFLSLVVLPLSAIFIYYLFVRGLPEYIFRQSFPYTGIGGQFSFEFGKLWDITVQEFWAYASYSWRNVIFLGIIAFTIVAFFISYRTIDTSARQKLKLVLQSLLIFLIFLLQEFYLTLTDYPYRVRWALPVMALIIFTMLAHGTKRLPRFVSIIVITLLTVLILHKVDVKFRILQAYASPEFYQDLDRVDVLIGNDPQWIRTVEDAVGTLKGVLAEDETFLAVPYDPLYYYLLDRPSPTYQTIFFDSMKIPPEQEMQTIKDLEDKNVNWILMSNRVISEEPTLGIFGKTNCVLLAQYIERNFHVVKELGCWNCMPVWNLNHGVRILRRNEKSPASN